MCHSNGVRERRGAPKGHLISPHSAPYRAFLRRFMSNERRLHDSIAECQLSRPYGCLQGMPGKAGRTLIQASTSAQTDAGLLTSPGQDISSSQRI